jgi:hypothetical protein
MERGDPLGEGVPGLELWERSKLERDAARQARYVSKLRAFLIESPNLPADLKEYLGTATDGEILANLIRPISWETDAGPLLTLLEEVKRRLVLFGSTKAIAARDAENVVGALHLEAWTVATRDKDRALDRAGFVRIFDDQTQTSISKADLAVLISRPKEDGQAAARLDDLAKQMGAIPPQVAEALEGRLRGIESALIVRGKPEAIDRDLARRFSLAERGAGFPEVSQANAFAALGREAMQAGSGTDAVRRRILLRATRAAAIRGELVDAEAFLAAAQVVPGPADETPARARLLEARGQVDEAIRLLRDRQDPDSLSTLMDIQRRAEGDGWVLEREELGMLLPDRLTSNGLITLTQILTRAGRSERVEALLAGASEEQLEACPVLLLLRAFNQLALTLPAPDRHLIKDGLPLIVAQLRPAVGGDELQRRLDDGLQDLTRLMAHLVDLELPATRSQVREIVRLFELMHPERQAKALSELRTLLEQPGQAPRAALVCLCLPSGIRPRADWPLSRDEGGTRRSRR